MMSNLTVDLRPSSYECPFTVGDFNVPNFTSFPKSANSAGIGLSIISGFAAIPTFWINLLVIWTILENEILRSVNYNLLLAILSLTDLLVGLVTNPFFIAFNISAILGCSSHCSLLVAYAVVTILCSGWSLATLMIASVERYLFIEHPLYYDTKVSTKKLLSAVAVTWLLVVMIVVLRLKLDDSYQMKQVPMALYFGISVIIILYCIAKVFKTAHRQIKAINAQHIAVQGPSTIADRIKEYKRTFALASIVLISIIFYCPFIVVKFISLANGKELNSSSRYVIIPTFAVFVHLQSLVNPLIFSIRLSYIRAGVVKKTVLSHLRWAS